MTSSVRAAEISTVSTGWRPGGFSSRMLRSMSPYCARARLRGIGVAVITRMSGARPFPPNSMRWRTPNRCCSSITASRRSWKVTSDWNSAWVPTRIAISPEASASSFAARAWPLSRPVSSASRSPAASASGGEAFEVLAGEDLGRRHHRGLSAGLDGREHRHERDQRLARADIPLQQAVHPMRRRHVGDDLVDRPALRARRAVGQGGEDLLAQMPVAGRGEALGAFHLCPGEGEGHLVGQHLVIGEALARRRVGGQIGRTVGRMGLGEGGAPAGPVAGPQQARLDPFGKFRRAAPARPGRRGSSSAARDPG